MDDFDPDTYNDELHQQVRTPSRKRRGNSIPVQRGSAKKKPTPFVTVRGVGMRMKDMKPGNKMPVTASKFGASLGRTTVSFADKNKLKALAKIGGATSVTESGYRILAAWLDHAMEEGVIANVRETIQEAQNQGVKTRVFGGHQKHLDIIAGTEHLAAPLSENFSPEVNNKAIGISRRAMVTYQANKSKLDASRPLLQAYAFVPPYKKRLWKALKHYYKIHPGKSASSLKLYQQQRLDTPMLQPAFEHDFPHATIPSLLVLLVKNGNRFNITIPSFAQYAQSAGLWNEMDALIFYSAIGNKTAPVTQLAGGQLTPEANAMAVKQIRKARTFLQRMKRHYAGKAQGDTMSESALKAAEKKLARVETIGSAIKGTEQATPLNDLEATYEHNLTEGGIEYANILANIEKAYPEL